MFTTKKDVDKHVRTGFAKLRTDAEVSFARVRRFEHIDLLVIYLCIHVVWLYGRCTVLAVVSECLWLIFFLHLVSTQKNLRGYSVAKLYARIGEHHSALHYVSTYLAVKDDSAQAHRLAGQCHERLKRPAQAIAAYQRSLQLDPKQSDLLIDACRLLLAEPSDDAQLAKPATLRYWCDLAEAQRVQHEAVVSLRMRLMRRDAFTPQQVDEMLQREIAGQPHSVALRIQLVRHMVDQRRLDEAFKYAGELEQRQQEHFAHSLDWYTSVAAVIAQLDQRDVTHSWPYWLLAVTAAERQLFLTLSAADRRSYAPAAQLAESAGLLHQFDQLLDRAARAVQPLAPTAAVAAAFVAHFGGQLCLHAATLVYRREQLQKQHWRDTQRTALPLLLLACNATVAGASGADDAPTTEPVRQLLRLWQRETAFRRVQAGRTLLALVDAATARPACAVLSNIRKICAPDKTGRFASGAELLAQVRQYCADGEWRRGVFRALFQASVGADQLNQAASSYLVQAPALAEPRYELPAADDLAASAETAQWLRPSSLALQVYLAVGGADFGRPATIAEFGSAVFQGLPVTAANLLSCGAETLSRLDVNAVLWATALQTQQRLVGEQQVAAAATAGVGAAATTTAAAAAEAVQHRPFANVAALLATEEQAAWWTAAFRVSVAVMVLGVGGQLQNEHEY